MTDSFLYRSILTAWAHKECESGTSDFITKAYTFDAVGNRATMAVSGAESYNVGYAHDFDNRLTTETKQIGANEKSPTTIMITTETPLQRKQER